MSEPGERLILIALTRAELVHLKAGLTAAPFPLPPIRGADAIREKLRDALMRDTWALGYERSGLPVPPFIPADHTPAAIEARLAAYSDWPDAP